MLPVYFLAFLAALPLPISSIMPLPDSPTASEAKHVEQVIAGGPWKGSFLQRDWTFEFAKQDGQWSGRYMRSDGRSWQSLQQLTISGRSVSFGIESKPKVSFALEVGSTNREMSGTVTIEGFATVPFSASRTS